MGDHELPVDLRTDRPTPARMYDYYLGGKDNFAVDREAAERVLAAAPEVRILARENRAFLRRAVRFMASEAGIRQFIDIGTGLPTQGNVHEVAQAVDPAARVVYVDNDPIVRAHGNALLPTDGTTVLVEADMRDPDLILGHPDVHRLIDFDEPVGVLFMAVLPFLPDEDDPRGVVATFTDGLMPGSHLALTHLAFTEQNPDSSNAITDVYKQQRTTSHVTYRSRADIAALFTGHDILDPGIVPLQDWRPDGTPSINVDWALGGVGRKH